MGKRKRSRSGTKPQEREVSIDQQIYKLRKQALALIRKSRSSKLRNTKKICKQTDQDLKVIDKSNESEYNNLLEKKKKNEEALEVIKTLDVEELLNQIIMDDQDEELQGTKKRITQISGLIDIIKGIRALQSNSSKTKTPLESSDDEDDSSEEDGVPSLLKPITSHVQMDENSEENSEDHDIDDLSNSFDSAEELGVVSLLKIEKNKIILKHFLFLQ